MLSFIAFLLLGATAFAACNLNMQPTFDSLEYIYYDGTNNVAPFSGWDSIIPAAPGAEHYTFSSIQLIDYRDQCDGCELSLYSTRSFGGRSISLTLQSSDRFRLDFCAKSFTLNCPQ